MGDIVPAMPQAALFALSVIVLGVAVFATSLTAAIGPLVGRSSAEDRQSQRKQNETGNHFIVIGKTSPAINTWRELAERGRPVTRTCERRRKKARIRMSTWWWAILQHDGNLVDARPERHHAEAVLGDAGLTILKMHLPVPAVKELAGPVNRRRL